MAFKSTKGSTLADFGYEMNTIDDPLRINYVIENGGVDLGQGIAIAPANPVTGAGPVAARVPDATTTGTSTTTGSTFLAKWGNVLDTPNMVNAGVTLLLGGLSTLLQAKSMSGVYKILKQQEVLAIENANIQAKRLQTKGNIQLANLRTKHALEQGKNELSAAGAGAGSLSGSTLDKLMSNRKYNMRDEMSQSLDTIWAVSNARRQGLNEAIQATGTAMQYAYKTRNDAFSGLFRGLSAAVGSVLADKRAYDSNVASQRVMNNEFMKVFDDLNRMYGNYDKTTLSGALALETSTDLINTNGGALDINTFSNSEQSAGLLNLGD